MIDTKGSRKVGVTAGLLVLVAGLIGTLVLTACAGGGGNGGNGENGETPRPWIVRYGFPTTGLWGVIGIDPQSTPVAIVTVQTAESLHRIDPDTLEVVPGLATSWEVASDHSYIDYFIRQGVRFHNGDLMTAEDVKFSYDRMYNEELVGPWAPIFQRFVDHVEIIGTDKVRVYFKEWSWSWLLNSPVIVPKSYIEEVGWEEWAEEPVLTGPLKIVDWERDVYVHFEKAFPEEGHWYYGIDIPNYDELYIYSVVEPATRLSMLKAGELDASHVPPANIPDVENDPNLTLVMSLYSCSWNVIFYDRFDPDSPLYNPNVRKAVSLAIDREGIGENVLHGTHEPWGSYWSPYILGYRYREPDPYDPDEARRLLEEAGYPNGFNTVFSYPLDHEVECEAVIASLATAGIRAEARGYEPTTWGTMLYYSQHIGMGYIHIPSWDGAYYPDRVFGDEIYHWAAQVSRGIPEIREAFDQMTEAATEEELIQAARAAEDLVLKLDYKIPVWAVHGAFAYGPTVENWNPSWPGDEWTQNLIILQYKG